MSLFKERLKQVMRSKSVRQIDVAAETRIPKAAISNYLAGRYEPMGERLYVLADFFGVSPAWLKGYSDNPNDNVINEETLDKVNATDPALIEKYNGDLDAAYAEQQRIDAEQARKDAHILLHTKPAKENPLHPESNISCVIPQDNIYKIPVFETVSAGLGAYASDEVLDYIPVILSNPYDVEKTIAIKVKGDSMYPKIEDGDIIVVRKQDSVDSGDIAVLLLDGEEGLVKKVVYGPDWIELHSFNPEYMTRRFEGADVLRLRIVGLVIGSYKKF